MIFAVWGPTGLKYDDIGDTVENVEKGIVLAGGVGAVYLIIVGGRGSMHEKWVWVFSGAIIVGIIALVTILETGDVVEPGADQLAEFAKAESILVASF